MTNIIIFDHNSHPIWQPVYKTYHENKNRTNGGYTYSCDISKFHIPIIKKVLNNQTKYRNILITSVGLLDELITPKNTDLIIYYLHEFLEREYKNIVRLQSWYKGKVVFITSRKNIYEKLQSEKIDVILLPMSIDATEFEKYKKIKKHDGKKVIYFGNMYLGKNKAFNQVRVEFLRQGWQFDYITSNSFNGKKLLSREKIFEIIAKYNYGIGEGRCFLEMNAMGLKTLICASACQGIITNETYFKKHQENNFSDGKVWTYSRIIKKCIENFDKAIIKTTDVREILPILENKLKRIL